jgi:hypothetical protein
MPQCYVYAHAASLVCHCFYLRASKLIRQVFHMDNSFNCWFKGIRSFYIFSGVSSVFTRLLKYQGLWLRIPHSWRSWWNRRQGSGDTAMVDVEDFYTRDSFSHTYVYTYIPWINECVTEMTGRGISHKYTNIHNFYSVKYYKHFTNSIIHHVFK